jgi:hypothetical protein
MMNNNEWFSIAWASAHTWNGEHLLITLAQVLFLLFGEGRQLLQDTYH